VGCQIVPGMLECEGLFYCLTKCIAGDKIYHWEKNLLNGRV